MVNEIISYVLNIYGYLYRGNSFYLFGMMKWRRVYSFLREFCRGVFVIRSLWLELNLKRVL